MRVTCLATQEQLFETRILKRMAEPAFVSPDDLVELQRHPLVLFGAWFGDSFQQGMAWLGKIAYRLRYPCLICQPFEPGRLEEELGLAVGLTVNTADDNDLAVDSPLVPLMGGKTRVQVQADFAFGGAAGKRLVTTVSKNLCIVSLLQPRNTDTPLVLCGARLFSTSALSDTADRQDLFEALLAWAVRLMPAVPTVVVSGRESAHTVDPELVKSVGVLLAGTGVATRAELAAVADAVFGLDLPAEEMERALLELAEGGWVSLEGDTIVVDRERLEGYMGKLGLGAYVRVLQDDFARRKRA